jgi:hypothetical protein
MGKLLLAAITAAILAAPQTPGDPDGLERRQFEQLLKLRRVYVDRLGSESNSVQFRDLIIAALERSRLFLVTEDETQADAYLRGSAEDLMFTEVRSSRDGLQARAAGASSRREGSESEAASASLTVGETEQRYSRELRREATAALRLVARNGDVLWSTTQESAGGKYKGSSRDVAERVVKDLAAAYARARRSPPGAPSPR